MPELTARGTNDGWNRVARQLARERTQRAPFSSRLPAMMVAWCTGILAAATGTLAIFDRHHWHILAAFATGLLIVDALIARLAFVSSPEDPTVNTSRP